MINLDRGVTIRFDPQGTRIHMYKDDPGRYWNTYGEPVDEAVARAAGFDVQRLQVERQRKARIEEARRRIDAEMDALENEEEEPETKDGFYVKHAGRGRYHVHGPQGQLTDTAVGKEEADSLIEEYRHGTSASSRQQPLNEGDGA